MVLFLLKGEIEKMAVDIIARAMAAKANSGGGNQPDLSNYVQFDDYATNNKTGVINGNINGFQVSSSGNPYAKEYTAEEYDNVGNQDFIGKGTLENAKDKIVGSSTPVQDLTATVTNVQNDQDESMPKQTASGEIVSVDDALAYKTFNVTVDGASEQVVTTGANLLPYPYPSERKEQSGVTFEVNKDGSITLNGTSTAFSSFQIYAGVGLNQALEIPGNYISGGNSKAQIGIYHNINNTDYPQLALNNSGFTEIDKSIYNTGYIEIRVSTGLTFNNETIFPMLSNEANIDWEPYTGGQPSPSPDYPQEITTLTFDKITICGKNIFDYDKFLNDIGDSLTIEGTNNNFTYRSNNSIASTLGIFKFNFKEKTSYSFSGKISSSSANGAMKVIYTDGTSFYIYSKWDGTSLSEEFFKTTDKTKTIKQIEISSYGNGTVFELTDFMISEGSTATEYEPYQATEYTIDLQGNEMVELPNGVKDELVVDKQGNVSLIKNVGKIILDGSEDENWKLDTISSGTDIRQFSIIFGGVYTNNTGPSPTLLSDYFQGVIWNNSWLKNNTVTPYKYGNSSGLRLYSNQFEDVNALKTWLSSHNTAVYYTLETPQPISLGKLSDIITTLNGTNNISINGNIPTTISTTYALDTKKYIDNKLAEISTAMIGVG